MSGDPNPRSLGRRCPSRDVVLIASIAFALAVRLAWRAWLSDLSILFIGAFLAVFAWTAMQAYHVMEIDIGFGATSEKTIEDPAVYTLVTLIAFGSSCVGTVVAALLRPDDDDRPV